MRKHSLMTFSPRSLMDEDFFGNFFNMPMTAWEKFSPVDVDLYEEGDNIVANMSGISGFSEDNLDINLEDNVLTVSGSVSKEDEEKDKGKKYYRKEIKNESFSRSITLPVKVKHEGIDAELKNGELKIIMPKAIETTPKKISIKAS